LERPTLYPPLLQPVRSTPLSYPFMASFLLFGANWDRTFHRLLKTLSSELPTSKRSFFFWFTSLQGVTAGTIQPGFTPFSNTMIRPSTYVRFFVSRGELFSSPVYIPFDDLRLPQARGSNFKVFSRQNVSLVKFFPSF